MQASEGAARVHISTLKWHLARLAAEHAEEVRPLLVWAALIAGVARGALRLEDLGTGIRVAII